MPSPIDPQKDILSKIFCRFLALHHMVKNVCQSILISFDKLRERAVIPLLGPQHQLHIGIMQVPRVFDGWSWFGLYRHVRSSFEVGSFVDGYERSNI